MCVCVCVCVCVCFTQALSGHAAVTLTSALNNTDKPHAFRQEHARCDCSTLTLAQQMADYAALTLIIRILEFIKGS